MSLQRGRLTLVTPSFAPEPIGTALYATDTARGLASLGWDVCVLTGQPHYPRNRRYEGYGRSRRRDVVEGIPVIRLPTVIPRSNAIRWRLLNEVNFLLQAAARIGHIRNSSVVSISPGTPWVVPAGRILTSPSGRHVALVHDLQSGLAASLGMTTHTVGRLVAANERLCLDRADHVLCLTEDMRREVASLGVRVPTHVSPLWPTIQNFAHLSSPTRSVQYSGNFGQKHGTAVLLELAVELRKAASDLTLIMRGQGPQFEALRSKATARGMSNTRFERPVPESDLPIALSASPVHLITQAPGTGNYVMPSKLINALACGCRVVAMADDASPLAPLSERLPGITIVRHGDVRKLAAAAISAVRSYTLEERDRIASAARQHFSRDTALAAIDQYLVEKE